MATEKAEALKDSNFQSYYNGIKDSMNSEFQSLLPGIADLKLHRQIGYALQTKGKRLRASIGTAKRSKRGGKRGRIRKMALAIEFLHLATLVHDDILDEDLFRRNALSVHAKWSVKEAVLGG